LRMSHLGSLVLEDVQIMREEGDIRLCWREWRVAVPSLPVQLVRASIVRDGDVLEKWKEIEALREFVNGLDILFQGN
jgi:hypothetical protein